MIFRVFSNNAEYVLKTLDLATQHCLNGNTQALVTGPLHQMSDWHLSLALAAGQVSGVVKSKDGKGYIPFGLNKLSSSLPLSCIIARFVQVVKVTAIGRI
jgi:hypothetical protein